MRKLTIQLSFLFCLLLLAVTASATPGSEADFKKLEKEYTFHNDGSMEFRCKKELTLNTHLAFNNLYGETFIIYNPQYQSLKFHTAYTKQADGTVIKVPANAYNEVLPHAAADAPAFNHLKEMVVTHTGLELGATIYLDYSVYTKPGYYKELDIDEVLQEKSPIREYTVKLTIPDSKTLSYSLTGSPVKPDTICQNGTKQYSWTIKNIPAASLAPYLPLDNERVPRLTASTYASTEAALESLLQLFNDSLPSKGKVLVQSLLENITNDNDQIAALQKYVVKQIANSDTLNETTYKLRRSEEIVNSTSNVEKKRINIWISFLKIFNGFLPSMGKALLQPLNKINDNYKIAAIQQYVAKQIATCPVTLSETGYTLRSNEEVLNSAYGTKEEKTNLLISMLKAAGYQPQLRVAYPRVHIEGLKSIRELAVECCGQNYSAITDTPPSMSVRGQLDTIFNVAPNRIYPMWLNQEETIEHTEKDSLSLEDREIASKTGYVVTPFTVCSPLGVKNWNMINRLNSQRSDVLELPRLQREKYTQTFLLPKDMELESPALDIELDKPFGFLKITIEPGENEVTVHRTLVLKQQQIPPAQYEEFRTFINTWLDKNNNQLIFKKK
ncbi:DUF3857 domain-containing protein [Parabacteroides pacaensis]|uniref:DUF3857 domain-containing protein n=1 Tax=Parabacteroides pacaensis TaxID=2086575 RepID=UPI000D0F5D98|nr:DUF3857 domain-containing protein [Parabacteroides pacaensis]